MGLCTKGSSESGVPKYMPNFNVEPIGTMHFILFTSIQLTVKILHYELLRGG